MTHADKRTVTTDALETLGQIHTRQERRDAIHLAVEPVEAGQTLRPGARIIVRDGIATNAGVTQEALGIVDPFLPDIVLKGQRFWFVMMPRMVHSLRHVWTHPAFPSDEVAPPAPVDEEKAQAEAWLRVKAEGWGLSYGRVLELADRYLDTGDIYVGGSELEGVWVDDEFWERYEQVRDRRVTDDMRGNFFTCSC
jgi:hypothetical protein